MGLLSLCSSNLAIGTSVFGGLPRLPDTPFSPESSGLVQFSLMPNVLERYAGGPVDVHHLAARFDMEQGDLDMALLGVVSETIDTADDSLVRMMTALTSTILEALKISFPDLIRRTSSHWLMLYSPTIMMEVERRSRKKTNW